MTSVAIELPKGKYRLAQHRLAMWDITYYCNLTCTHCFNQEFVDKRNERYISLEQSQGIIRQLVADGFDEINLVGGEPLSVPDIVPLVEFGLRTGKKISINTNGLLLTPQLAERFVRLGFSQIAFSIAGLREDTNAPVRGVGSLQRLKDNIRHFTHMLAVADVPNCTSLNLSLTSINLDDLANLYSFCRELSVSAASVHRTEPIGAAFNNQHVIERNEELVLDRMEELIRTWGSDIRLTLDVRPATSHFLRLKYRLNQQPIFEDCSAGERNICVRPDGSQLACRLQLLHKRAYKNGASSPPAAGVQSFVKWKEFIPKPAYCSGCPFVQICTPCPLVPREQQPSECQVVLARIEAYNRKILDERLHTMSDVQIQETKPGELVLSRNGRRYGLSRSAQAIWRLIDNRSTLGQIVERLLPHGLDDEHLRDVVNYIHDLRARDLVYLQSDLIQQPPIDCFVICCAR